MIEEVGAEAPLLGLGRGRDGRAHRHTEPTKPQGISDRALAIDLRANHGNVATVPPPPLPTHAPSGPTIWLTLGSSTNIHLRSLRSARVCSYFVSSSCGAPQPLYQTGGLRRRRRRRRRRHHRRHRCRRRCRRHGTRRCRRHIKNDKRWSKLCWHL